jgi:pSer/pThr/pTyr-binding forkhead associated (FHA) protein
MPFLEHDGVTRELPQGDTLVGSGSEADWRLLTINLAPRHFMVSVDAAGVTTLSTVRAQDVEVNGEAITAPRVLAHGDEVIAGAGVFAYHQSVEPAAPTGGPSGGGRGFLIDIAGLVAFPLGEAPVRIGRDPTSDVVVRDATVARFHAEVRPAAGGGGGFTIRSMGAAGSTVNGALIGGTPRPLTEGDLIRMGTTTLRFTTAAPPAAARVAARSEPPTASRSRLPPLPQRPPESTLGATPPPVSSPSLGGTVRAAATRPRIVAVTVVVVLAVAALIATLLRGGHGP